VAHPGAGRLAADPPCDLLRGLAVTIGPEGGFTVGELEEAKAFGHRAIGLGPTILRVETAAVVACATVLAWAEPERGEPG
jgi:16S rRNA (uracil1498-N3)-methyltransferase